MDGLPVPNARHVEPGATGMPRGRSLRPSEGRAHPVTADVARLRIGFVNVYFVGAAGAGSGGWTLVDAGLPGSAGRIRRAAEERYGRGVRPNGIVMTHAHFDHVGALKTLADEWDVPIFAHELELPYLTGRSSYPPFDPGVGGGAVAALSWLYPRGPIDVLARVQPLPNDGRVPGMPGWMWIETPGHSPGHVSFFREQGRIVIAGDAVVTTKQESLIASFAEPPLMHGPPAYGTPDWETARRSVQKLAALQPEVLATGHGIPLGGAAMREALTALAIDFRAIAVPQHGRYTERAARTDERGVQWVPPENAASKRMRTLTLGGVAVAGALIAMSLGRRREEWSANEGMLTSRVSRGTSMTRRRGRDT